LGLTVAYLRLDLGGGAPWVDERGAEGPEPRYEAPRIEVPKERGLGRGLPPSPQSPGFRGITLGKFFISDMLICAFLGYFGK
jgi:hypothetical protein